MKRLRRTASVCYWQPSREEMACQTACFLWRHPLSCLQEPGKGEVPCKVPLERSGEQCTLEPRCTGQDYRVLLSRLGRILPLSLYALRRKTGGDCLSRLCGLSCGLHTQPCRLSWYRTGQGRPRSPSLELKSTGLLVQLGAASEAFSCLWCEPASRPGRRGGAQLLLVTTPPSWQCRGAM